MKNFIKENLPNSHIVSEEIKESWNIPTNAEYIVTVDPIDGTENFVSGLKEWGIGISIYHNDRHFRQ